MASHAVGDTIIGLHCSQQFRNVILAIAVPTQRKVTEEEIMVKRSLFVLGVFLVIPLSAQAEHGHAYVGAGLGKDTFKVTDDSGIPSVSRDEKKTAVVLFGGYQFTQNWGVEGGYVNFGKLSNVYRVSGINVTAEAEAYSIYAAGTATLPLSNQFSVFGKAGLSLGHSNISASAGGVSLGDSGYENSILVGVGALFNVSKNFAVALEYVDFDKVADDVKVNAWLLSGRYNFR